MVAVRASVAAAALVVALARPARAEDGVAQCVKFDQIYSSGRDICEKLWGGAFKYVPKGDPEYDLAYTMWFFGTENPNDAVSKRRIELGLHPLINDTNDCHLEYFHHDVPSKEGNDFRECHPWNEKACCKKDTIKTPDAINTAYGDGFRWDRCGELSEACERFFVQEACFYECDVNAGLFRKYGTNITNYTLDVNDANHWELHGMPIRGDYCDSFYLACKDDLFTTCKDSDGNFFECARVPDFVEKEPAKEDDELSAGAIVAIVLASIAGVIMIAFLVLLIRRERMGNPVFQPIEPSADKPAGAPQGQGSASAAGAPQGNGGPTAGASSVSMA